jgi:ribosome-binding protein aMBF1 (putative translation factor)
MKNIFLLLFAIFVVNVSFAQQKPKTEPTEMSIPYDVAQKMLLDLNDYDRLKELSKLDKEEIKQLNNKILYLEKTINTWEQKDTTLNKEIISNVEQKFKIVNDQNEELRKEVKKLKAKNTITQIISGALITTLTVFSIIK